MNDNFETNESLDFDFKPINKGLGFHQKNNPIAKPLSEAKPKQLRPDLQKQYQQDLLQRTVTIENTDLRKKSESTKIEIEEKVEVEASFLHRSVAFIVDLLFIVSNVLLTIYVLANMTKIDLTDLMGIDLILLCSGLSVFYYLLYFSVFELMPWSTFGKYFCNLKVVCDNGSRLSFNESLLRSLLSVVGLPLLIFNWHGKLTGTKVMEA